MRALATSEVAEAAARRITDAVIANPPDCLTKGMRVAIQVSTYNRGPYE
jgi:hypothetical protein